MKKSAHKNHRQNQFQAKIIGAGIAIMAIAMSIYFAAISQAAIYGRVCDLAVFPYNPNPFISSLIGTAGDAHINSLSEGDCQSHISYGSAYQPQPPQRADAPVQPGSENERVPIAQHQHAYFNDSDHSVIPPGATSADFYYKSFVDRFEIKLESDAFNNINLSAITCDTTIPTGYTGDASDIFDCDGYVSDLFGGTRVSITPSLTDIDRINAGRPGTIQSLTITWDFAENPGNLGRPQIYGNNGSAFVTYNTDGTPRYTLDLTDPYNRTLEFHVNLPTLQKAEDIWSATTTSRVLLADLALYKPNYPQYFNDGCPTNNPIQVDSSTTVGSGWCYLSPEAQYPVEQVQAGTTLRNYFWANIGSVSTIWRKPPTIVAPPPREIPPPPPPPTFEPAPPPLPPPPLVRCGSITVVPGPEFRTDATPPITFTITSIVTDPPGGVYTGGFDWSVSNPNERARIAVRQGDETVAHLDAWTENTIVTVASKDGAPGCRAVITPRSPLTPPPPPTGQTLTLIKTVINRGNGNRTVADFPLYIDGGRVNSGVANPVAPGQHFAREDTLPGYIPTLWSGDCTQSGLVDVPPGTNKVCFITNEYFEIILPPPPPGPPPNPPPAPPPTVCTDLRVDRRLFIPDPRLTQRFSVTINPSSLTNSITWVHIRDGLVVASRSGVTTAEFNGLTVRSLIRVSASPAIPGYCVDEIRPGPLQPNPPRGLLEKRAFTLPSGGNVIRIDPNGDQNEVAEFEITFTADSFVPEVTIIDSFQGDLVGSEYGVIRLERGAFNGRDFRIEQQLDGRIARPLVPECSTVRSPLIGAGPTCFDRGTSPFNRGGLILHNVDEGKNIYITYRGRLTQSYIDDSYCRGLDPSLCGEVFTNNVRAEGPNIDEIAFASLYTPCPFLLTLGVGDVILEEDFSSGGDIFYCSRIPNVQGPVITQPPPPPPGIPRTGAGEPNIPSHDLCKTSNLEVLDPTNPLSDTRPEGYKNPLKRVSSALCEVSLTLAESLTKPKIRDNIAENIERITRANNNLGTGRSVTINNLTDLRPFLDPTAGQNTNENFEIYKLKNSSLTIGGNLPVEVGPGARTIVVENGDLIINQDIVYNSGVAFDFNNLKEIPSIAFIVVNGNIRVAPTVTKISGVFVALEGNGLRTPRRDSGKITGDRPIPGQEYILKIEGSVYGDIQPLFSNRGFIGNASLGQGSVVINYDGRLFYNMPPGLQEVLDLEQEQVAR